MHRVSKGAPEQVQISPFIFDLYAPDLLSLTSQILNLAHNKSEIERRVHSIIDKFAERGLRSLAVAYQVK